MEYSASRFAHSHEPIKQPRSAAQAEIDRQVGAFLKRGGSIVQVPTGVSGEPLPYSDALIVARKKANSARQKAKRKRLIENE